MSWNTVTQMGHLRCLIWNLCIISLSSAIQISIYSELFILGVHCMCLYLFFFTSNRLPLQAFYRTLYFYLEIIFLQVSEKEISYNFSTALLFLTFEVEWQHRNNDFGVAPLHINFKLIFQYFSNCIFSANGIDMLADTFLPEKHIYGCKLDFYYFWAQIQKAA